MHCSTPLIPLFLLASRSCAYTLLDSYHPGNFFSSFTFFTDTDPTTGFVQYKSQSDAIATNLIGTSPQASNAIYIGVDSTTKSPLNGRASVRLSSKKTYDKGLIIADIAHMPGGICGVWPAFWMLGSGTWPQNGEIDILEGVNDAANNSMTLHTNAGCRIQKTGFSGTLETADCDVSDPAQGKNAGCQIQDPRAQSYGAAFNAQGGAVMATEVTSQGIKIWSFPRGNVPADVSSGSPDPDSWGMPIAAFAGECDIDQHFKGMSILFDTTFCGQWAGQVWSQSSCAAKAPTCEAFVKENPEAFGEAYWLVNGINVYTKQAPSRIMKGKV